MAMKKLLLAASLLALLVILPTTRLSPATAKTVVAQTASGTCIYAGCNGLIENQVNPPCSTGELTLKSDPVYNSGGALVGYLKMFQSNACESFWAGFVNTNVPSDVLGVTLAVGNYNTQKEGSPTYNSIGLNGWGSSYMFETNELCKSAWVSGATDPYGVLVSFSHKLIYGGTGC
jgi:hypothetical protein